MLLDTDGPHIFETVIWFVQFNYPTQPEPELKLSKLALAAAER